MVHASVHTPDALRACVCFWHTVPGSYEEVMVMAGTQSAAAEKEKPRLPKSITAIAERVLSSVRHGDIQGAALADRLQSEADHVHEIRKDERFRRSSSVR